MRVSVGTWFLEESWLYHLDVTFGQALRNHLSEGGAIEIARLLAAGLCDDLGNWLGHDQGVDLLTLNSITPLRRTTAWQSRCRHHLAVESQLGGMQSSFGDEFATV